MHNFKTCNARITLGVYCEVCERQVGLLADINALRAELARVKAEVEAATDMAIHYRDSAMAGDVVIGKLLARIDARCSRDFHARACEIAGRKE